MKFTSTAIDGAWIIDIDPLADDRGLFARLYDRDAFLAQGIDLPIPEINLAVNAKRGTLRGMHYQTPPHAEGKLVHCIAGAVFDVIVDLRRDSATLGRWLGLNLDAESHRALYAPPGCAHGYISLTDRTKMFYLMSNTYAQDAAHGLRWNDPRVGVAWPIEPTLISDRDRAWPDWDG
jgi:dTDP-4-dehydrorhamnose 3,5-epimerase